MVIENVTQPPDSQVVIEMWADVGCPWCYLGKHRLRSAIAQRPDADRFDIVIRSFELDPNAPHEPEKNEESFIRTHGGTAADLLQAERHMQVIARKEGLEYSIDRLSANTFDVHRVVQYASDQGRGFAFFSAVQDGLFTGSLNPYAPGALESIAESVGLSGQRVAEILASNEYADRVHADRDEARELGVTGVPFVVVDRRVASPGAQKVPGYVQMLEQVAGPVPSERAS